MTAERLTPDLASRPDEAYARTTRDGRRAGRNHAGKGDAPRNCWSHQYRRNFDAIKWRSRTRPRRHQPNRESK